MPSTSLHIHRTTTASTSSPMGDYQKQPHPTVRGLVQLTRGMSSVPDSVARYHTHALGPNQCGSAAVQSIDAPVGTVWSLVRRFDKPQAYKHFLKSCHVIVGDGVDVGSLREVQVVSGLKSKLGQLADKSDKLRRENAALMEKLKNAQLVQTEMGLDNVEDKCALPRVNNSGSLDGSTEQEGEVYEKKSSSGAKLHQLLGAIPRADAVAAG